LLFSPAVQEPLMNTNPKKVPR